MIATVAMSALSPGRSRIANRPGDTRGVPPSLVTDAFVGRRHSIERILVCAMQGQFPVLARGIAGELAVVFRTGAGHYGLSGTLATACSTDGGRRWSDPIEVAPRGDDVRNPALGIAADGRWVLAYWKASVRCYPTTPGTDDRRWRLPLPGTLDEPDLFVVFSADRGRTWTSPQPHQSSRLAWCSPFGRIVQAPDGSLLMAAYGARHDARAQGQFDAIVIRSRDGGASWGDESLVLANGSELSLCFTSPGELVGAVRRSEGDTAIVRSSDGGHTWSSPVAVTRPMEHPADLCSLRGGRLLMTFGRRRRPLGCGALTSADGGATWSVEHEAILAGDGIGNDVGYPSTVQLDDATIVTVLYFARGSAPSEPADGWGDTSCQALRYREELVVPAG